MNELASHVICSWVHLTKITIVYGCTYPISDVLFRNLARAAAGRPLDVHDGVLGRSGNKWEAHSGSTRPGEFCGFDGTLRVLQ